MAYDFDMKFIFVYVGWECTAIDWRIFIDAITRASNNFPISWKVYSTTLGFVKYLYSPCFDGI